ncbi:MAG: hypothetical protein QNI99_02820 [Woeseiaceae bacterium]|nr:hypothetical protein [Woeseiaceae bacterium]
MRRKIERLPVRGIRLITTVCTMFALGFAGLAHAEYIFRVDPSGDLSGETDWANIVQAFDDAKAAGPGNTVRLARGTFYIPRPLQIANFSGTFKGAGKGKTILRMAPGIEFGLLEPPMERMGAFMAFWLDGRDPTSDTYWPADRVQDITVSGFTIIIDGPVQEWWPYCAPVGAGLRSMNFIDVRGRHTVLQHPWWEFHPDDIMKTSLVNATFEKLELIADGVHGQNGTQVWGEGVTIPCPDDPGFQWVYTNWMSGTQLVRRNSYDSHWGNAIGFYNMVDSSITVGGSRRNGIKVRNGLSPLYTWELSNSFLHASHIRAVDTASGIAFEQGIEAFFGAPAIRTPEPSDFEYTHNRLRHSDASNIGSFELYDYAAMIGLEPAVGSVVVADNRVRTDGDGSAMGVYSTFIDDLAIINNRVNGRGFGAIVVDAGQDCVIDGNRVHRFESVPGPEQIRLGAGTNNCTVVVNEDVRLIVNGELVHPGDDHKPPVVEVLDMGTGNQFVVEDYDDCDDENDD